MTQPQPININTEPLPTELGQSLRSFVGSYSRASMMHMAENVILSDHLTDEDEEEGSFANTQFTEERANESSPLLSSDLCKTNTNSSILTAADNYQLSLTNQKSTFLQSIFNSINILLGIGILALPLGFKSAGWFIGLLVFIFCFGLTNYTAKVLVKCLSVHPHSKTYGDMGAYTFGLRGRVFISFFFLTELITCSIALVVLLTDGISSLFPAYPIMWIRLASFLILTPTLFIPVRQLAYTSLLGIFSVFCLLCVILYDGLTKFNTPGSLIEPADTSFLPQTWWDVPLSFGLIMAGFAGHAVFPTIYHDMENPKDYKRMVNYSYLTVAAIYMTVAASGYIMFGSATMQEITQNLMSIVEYNPALNRFAVYTVALNPIAKYGLTMNPILLSLQTSFSKGFSHLGKFLCILMSTVTLFVLVILLPNFDRVISLLGAFFSFFISGIFPLVCHVKLFGKTLSRSELWLNLVLIVVALLMAIAGTIKSFI